MYIKQSPLGKVTPQDGKSPQLTADHVEEPVAEDMVTEKPVQETKDSTTTFGLEFHSMSNYDQELQGARKDEKVIDVPRIYFIFGDQQWKIGDYDMMVRFFHMTYPTVR